MGRFEEWAEDNHMYERACDDYTFEDAIKAWNEALDVAAAEVSQDARVKILAHKCSD